MSKFSGAECAQTSSSPLPSRKGDQRPLVDTVGYSFQTCWLLQFLLKPLAKDWNDLPNELRVDGLTLGSRHSKINSG